MSTKSVALKRNKTVNEIERVLNKKIYRDVTILGGVAMLAGGMIAFKFLEKQIGEWFKNSGTKTIEGELNENNLSYPISQYVIYADQIEQSLQTSMSNGAEVIPVFAEMNNDDDVAQLIISFGSRTNYWFGVPTYKKPLSYWITDELKRSELTDLNQVLANKGISFRFGTNA